ncbi:MAG: tRNA lysidine(34) synthetase TilS [Pseudomonadota bacterium]
MLDVEAKTPLAPPDLQRSALDVTRFAQALERLGPFEEHPHLAVGVSGGPDSMALTLLAHTWATERGGSILGLTVDHGMRPESAAEAKQVGEWLSTYGIAHQILTNNQPVPASGIHANLREVRLRLLTETCQERGVLHLLLAHHCDDQAETVAMRRQNASGPDGLAGMSAVRCLRTVRLLRPLLEYTKRELVAFLDECGQLYFTDPSNADPRFGRGRLRELDPDSLVPFDRSEAPQKARARQERESKVAAWLAENVLISPLGYIIISPAGWKGALDQDLETVGTNGGQRTALSGFAHCLWSLGGTPYPPSLEQVTQALTNGRLDAGRATNLAGCLISPYRHALVISREPHSFTAASCTPADWAKLSGQSALAKPWGTRWGSLYTVESPAPWPESVTIAPLSESRPTLQRFSTSDTAPIPYDSIPGSARSAIPALWANGRIIAVPLLNGVCDDTPDGLISFSAGVRISLSPLRPVAPGSFEVACTEASAHYLSQ